MNKSTGREPHLSHALFNLDESRANTAACVSSPTDHIRLLNVRYLQRKSLISPIKTLMMTESTTTDALRLQGNITPPLSEKDEEIKHVHGMKNIDPIAAISHASAGSGITIASIPKFVSFQEQRQWQLEHMAAAFRHWSRQGYVFGISGHISVRDPEYHDAFWTNPLGVHFGLLRASDMILLSLDGEVLHPPDHRGPDAETLSGLKEHRSSQRAKTRPANAAGFLIHAALHKRRPEIHAALHCHTPHGRAYSAFAKVCRHLKFCKRDINPVSH